MIGHIGHVTLWYLKCHVVELFTLGPCSHFHSRVAHSYIKTESRTTMSVQGSSTSGSTPVSDDNFTKLMEAIQASQTQLDLKLAKFKEELMENQEKAATSAVRKVRQEPYAFKKKSHQEQFRTNEKIDEALLEAETELESTGPAASSAVKRAQEAISAGRKLIAERQKLIKIADRSDLGWAVVAEYTADELAEDSDDEKRLEKAERAAERKAAKRRKAPERRPKPYGRPQQGQPLPSTGPVTTALIPGASQKRPLVTPLPQRQVGPCFACGQMGHLRSFCPKTAGSSNSTKSWYPPLDDTCGVSGEGHCVSKLPLSSMHPKCVTESTLCEVYDGDFEAECVNDASYFSEVTLESEKDTVSEFCVKDRLKEHAGFWKEELEASEAVLSVIESGYVLPLKFMPDPFVQKNQLSAQVHADLYRIA